ncbi:MAG: hypothetical protein E6Q42_05285 [Dechloromonas sp.]|jgi:hypothetical protein|nr:hypothetical protein [Xanthomonadales bacterium]TXI77328.1 MAG: hypothetical protein E6Q42_05285 [Dechloromonas sp.]
MNFNHISSALDATGIAAEVLSVIERQALVLRLRARLGVDVTADAPWDDDAAPDGCFRSNGWELIPDYVGVNRCFLFLEGARTVWRFRTGADLLCVLKECPALEFYVCDEDSTYLLCSNHHDFVVGWGAATCWVDNLSATVNESRCES